jgi:hypothetical protein
VFGEKKQKDSTSGFRINTIKGREIIGCRSFPTVQVDVWVDNRLIGRADVHAGRSTGSHEAHELRDREDCRCRGLSVQPKPVEGAGNPFEFPRCHDADGPAKGQIPNSSWLHWNFSEWLLNRGPQNSGTWINTFFKRYYTDFEEQHVAGRLTEK